MATDRKADFVGDHGGKYVDMDGNRRQFTYIDHDPKTKISGCISTDDEIQAAKSSLVNTDELVERVMQIPASLCPLDFYEFTVRGEGQSVVEWNETMLRDAGLAVTRLRDLAVLLENRYETKMI